MKELLRTSDPVRLSWLTALLADQNIDVVVLDGHTSILEGSANAIPRRLVVNDQDYNAAMSLLAEAGEIERKAPTNDRILGGRVFLSQPDSGYRAAIDPVLLAAATPAVSGRVLDVGTGVGTAALCYTQRVKGARAVGLELQAEMAALAQDNIDANDLADRVSVVCGDLLRPPPEIEERGFDHVMANPPYLPPARAEVPPHPAKATAMIEGEADLAAWVRFCLNAVKPKGSITMIHRADRLDELLALLHGQAGGIIVFPLWPGKDRPAKRVIVQARRDVRTPLRLSPGLVLHTDSGTYSQDALSVLQDGGALNL